MLSILSVHYLFLEKTSKRPSPRLQRRLPLPHNLIILVSCPSRPATEMATKTIGFYLASASSEMNSQRMVLHSDMGITPGNWGLKSFSFMSGPRIYYNIPFRLLVSFLENSNFIHFQSMKRLKEKIEDTPKK